MKRTKVFSFFKKKSPPLKPINIPSLIVDIHSHLIPGIDDGASTLDESIQLLTILENTGYQKVITTPHIMYDAYKNTKKSILFALQDLQEKVKSEGLNIQIEAAAEYYLDEGLLPLIKKKEILLIANKYLLFETSYTHRPAQLEEIIFEILATGYTPLLAHPERYRYIDNPLEFQKLKTLGVEFQINLNSFNGLYGKYAQKHALYLSQHGLIDFLGSDVHNSKQAKNLKNVLTSEVYQDIYHYNTIKNPKLYTL